MNIIKGIDRVAWIIAVLAVPIGFVLGCAVTEEKYKVITTAYQAWEKEYGDLFVKDTSSPLYGAVLSPWNRPEPPKKYEYPEGWKSALGGTFSAIVFFVGTLAFIRVSSRGLKKLSLWVIEGFRNI